MHRRTIILAMSLLLATLAGVAVGQELRVEYEGELIDEGARPLGGVFALSFKLYPTADATEPIWSERHYVAVVDGEYTVELGNTTPLDPTLAGTELFVAIEFLDQEILRVPLTMRPAQTVEQELGALILGQGEARQLTFAQLADRALIAEEAEHAQDCDTLGGKSLTELDRTDELIERLAEHQADPDAHGRRQSAIGSSTTVLQPIGGEGGQRYTRMCPAGYVMVGLRGGAAVMMDSIEVVCAPLE